MVENKGIDISQFDKADVLRVLYDRAKPQGMGIFHYNSASMTKEEASTLLEKGTYFDYLHGRVMKVNLSSDTLAPWLYDRDNGHGAAQSAIDTIE